MSRINTDSEIVAPEGMCFLQLIWGQENDCESKTDECIPTLGEKAPLLMERIGTVLSLLDRIASCWWRCRSDDHMIEYLCGRVGSTARAALRLLRFGLYDESLLCCRAIGEIANLLQLFHLDADALEEWRTCHDKKRMTNFSAFRVRLRLESLNQVPIITKDRYRLLSKNSAHVGPQTMPQAHNMSKMPIVGAELQKQGLLICLNEIALPLPCATLFGAVLLDYEGEIMQRISSAATGLVEVFGKMNITEVDNYHSWIREMATKKAQGGSSLGERLKDAREYRGLSKDEVAQHIGVSRSAISLMESGERNAGASELSQLAALYKTNIEILTESNNDTESVGPVAGAAADLSEKDRNEVLRFVEFLRSTSAE